MRAAVLGRPVGHSLSPLLHRAAYAALGLDWAYDAVDLGPDELSAFLASCGPEWAGLSLTMPLKQAVLPLLTSVSPLAAAVAAANTVVLRDGRREGHNTDVHGIVAALREAGVESVSRAVVLGGGATARSALAALAELGERSPVLVVRSSPDETLAAAARLGVTPAVHAWDPSVLDGCDLLVSTVPAGAADALAPHVGDVPVVLDVAYGGSTTGLEDGTRGTFVSGVRMLLHQAAAQVELMTGRPAPLAAMDAALARSGRRRAAGR
ncbi:MAG TPA: shikimate dehydrogenase [Mycobacteriales bacterium]|nr:shikimate dehydrogenase [Mycobacteriales bacterium]